MDCDAAGFGAERSTRTIIILTSVEDGYKWEGIILTACCRELSYVDRNRTEKEKAKEGEMMMMMGWKSFDV